MSTSDTQQARIAKALATVAGAVGVGLVLAAIPEIPLIGVIVGAVAGLAGGAFVSKDIGKPHTVKSSGQTSHAPPTTA